MPTNPKRIPRTGILVLGLLIGWGLDHLPRPGSVVKASGADRSGESILASGPVQVGYNNGTKVQLPLDAIYYLDYKAGRILATIPSFKQSVGAAKLIDTFAERDLVSDFKLNLDSGPRPQFLMTTGSLGTYSDGFAPLFVFETTTGQVAVYKVQQQMVGAKSTPKFELMELRALPRPSLRRTRVELDFRRPHAAIGLGRLRMVTGELPGCQLDRDWSRVSGCPSNG